MISYGPLAATLKRMGKTFDDLAAVLDKKVGRFRLVINNGRYISIKELEKICTAFKCTPNDVIKFLPGEDKGAERVTVNWEAVKNLRHKPWSELSTFCKLAPDSLQKACKRGSTLDPVTFKNLCTALRCKAEDIKAERSGDPGFAGR